MDRSADVERPEGKRERRECQPIPVGRRGKGGVASRTQAVLRDEDRIVDQQDADRHERGEAPAPELAAVRTTGRMVRDRESHDGPRHWRAESWPNEIGVRL